MRESLVSFLHQTFPCPWSSPTLEYYVHIWGGTSASLPLHGWVQHEVTRLVNALTLQGLCSRWPSPGGCLAAPFLLLLLVCVLRSVFRQLSYTFLLYTNPVFRHPGFHTKVPHNPPILIIFQNLQTMKHSPISFITSFESREQKLALKKDASQILLDKLSHLTI